MRKNMLLCRTILLYRLNVIQDSLVLFRYIKIAEVTGHGGFDKC